jgi:hypothetical protein
MHIHKVLEKSNRRSSKHSFKLLDKYFYVIFSIYIKVKKVTAYTLRYYFEIYRQNIAAFKSIMHVPVAPYFVA